MSSSKEVLLLLRHGFADGAHARWRTLHEISVIAEFIFQHGNEVAEQYMNHSTIGDVYEVELYKTYHRKLHYKPPNQEEIDSIKANRKELINRYGKDFANQYGWASKTLSNKNPNLTHLEEHIGFNHLRPFVKLANVNIHAGSKGAILRLGSPPGEEEFLIVGPSIFGLGEPAQNTAYSFLLLTKTLLATKINMDTTVFLIAAENLLHETFWAFDEVMEAQESETNK